MPVASTVVPVWEWWDSSSFSSRVERLVVFRSLLYWITCPGPKRAFIHGAARHGAPLSLRGGIP